MELQELKELVGDGKIFSVEFYKRSDGSYRRMLARTGVKKGLSGGGSPYDPAKHGLLTVYDLQSEGYRQIPADNIIQIKARGKVVHFRGKL